MAGPSIVSGGPSYKRPSFPEYGFTGAIVDMCFALF